MELFLLFLYYNAISHSYLLCAPTYTNDRDKKHKAYRSCAWSMVGRHTLLTALFNQHLMQSCLTLRIISH